MAFTLATSNAIVTKAGAAVSSTASTSAAILEQFSNEAESFIAAESRYDFVSNYSTLGANAKIILGDIASSLAAMKLIAYDMTGYISRSVAETLLDVLRDNSQQGLNLIKDQKVATFIKT